MFGRLATRRASPSVDLYFLNACGDFVGPDGPVRQLAPTVFESGAARLVIRHDAGAPPIRHDRRLIYFLDDAIFDGLRDATMPFGYRAKLRIADCAAAARLLPRADALVVSRAAVAESLPSRLLRADAEISEIAPFWTEDFAALDHFDDPPVVEAAFLGAGTHTAGAVFASQVAERAMRAAPRLRFVVSANHRRRFRPRVDPGRIRFIEAMAWDDYRRSIGAMRAHIVLYPLPDTAFARARSVNKLIEHALFGAAPLYSTHWAPARMATDAGGGVVLPDDPEAWASAVVALAADPDRARALAAAARRIAMKLNRRDPQRALWARLLGLDPSGGGAFSLLRGDVVC